VGCCGLLWVGVGCCGPLWAAVGCCGLLWAAVGCCGLLWAAVGCCGPLWAAVGCCGLLWAAVGCCGLLWVGVAHPEMLAQMPERERGMVVKLEDLRRVAGGDGRACERSAQRTAHSVHTRRVVVVRCSER
jgi:hypothetical protein